MNIDGTDITPAIEKDLRRRCVSLYMVGRTAALQSKSIAIHPGSVIESPTLEMSTEQATALLTELWNAGFRPEGYTIEEDHKLQVQTLEAIITRYKSIVKSLVDMPG